MPWEISGSSVPLKVPLDCEGKLKEFHPMVAPGRAGNFPENFPSWKDLLENPWKISGPTLENPGKIPGRILDI